MMKSVRGRCSNRSDDRSRSDAHEGEDGESSPDAARMRRQADAKDRLSKGQPPSFEQTTLSIARDDIT